MRKRKRVLLSALIGVGLFFTGCERPLSKEEIANSVAEAKQKDEIEHLTCLDTRDGERFSYSSENIKEVVIRDYLFWAELEKVSFRDDNSTVRVFPKGSESYIKCRTSDGNGTVF